jgi:dolichyl-phosphate beta-glucosyltransferase
MYNIKSRLNQPQNTSGASNASNSLFVIVPCYNEYKRLPVVDFENFLEGHKDVTYCFVNDASTDATQKLLNGLKKRYPLQVKTLKLDKNVGKAEAIRQGVLFLNHSAADYIAFLDADLSAPLSELYRLFRIAKDEGLQFVLGSRVAIFGSNISRNPFRHYLGRFFATMASMALNLAIYDTQCGLKIFSYGAAQPLFDDPFISRWIFDVEIIMRLKLIHGQNHLPKVMKEIPLYDWVEKGDSKIKFWEMLNSPIQLIKIKRYYRERKQVVRELETTFSSNEIIPY